MAGHSMINVYDIQLLANTTNSYMVGMNLVIYSNLFLFVTYIFLIKHLRCAA